MRAFWLDFGLRTVNPNPSFHADHRGRRPGQFARACRSQYRPRFRFRKIDPQGERRRQQRERRRAARVSREKSARGAAQADRAAPGYAAGNRSRCGRHQPESRFALGPARREAGAGREEHHRDRERQGRCRQVDDGGEPRAGARRRRRAGRRARRRHLRAIAADDAGHQRAGRSRRTARRSSRSRHTACRRCRSAF